MQLSQVVFKVVSLPHVVDRTIGGGITKFRMLTADIYREIEYTAGIDIRDVKLLRNYYWSPLAHELTIPIVHERLFDNRATGGAIEVVQYAGTDNRASALFGTRSSVAASGAVTAGPVAAS